MQRSEATISGRLSARPISTSSGLIDLDNESIEQDMTESDGELNLDYERKPDHDSDGDLNPYSDREHDSDFDG